MWRSSAPLRLSDSGDTFKLAGLPTSEGGAAAPEDTREARQRDGPLVATDAQIHQLLKLLKSIGLDPHENGMDLAETRDRGWLWMTAEEASTHDRPDARIGSNTAAGPVDDQAAAP